MMCAYCHRAITDRADVQATIAVATTQNLNNTIKIYLLLEASVGAIDLASTDRLRSKWRSEHANRITMSGGVGRCLREFPAKVGSAVAAGLAILAECMALLATESNQFDAQDAREALLRALVISDESLSCHIQLSERAPLNYQVCLDASATDEFCWFVRIDGEQIGHVLEVAGDAATYDNLNAAIRCELELWPIDTVQVVR